MDTICTIKDELYNIKINNAQKKIKLKDKIE
jgi:hypothetical protein